MSKKKEYQVSTTIYHTNYVEATSEEEAEKLTQEMLQDSLEDSYNIDRSEFVSKDDGQYHISTTIFHTNYVEADSEEEAEQLTQEMLQDTLDDSYNIDYSETVSCEEIKENKI